MPSWDVTPDRTAVRAYYARLDLPVRAVARTLDRLVRDALPRATVGIKWGVPFYALKVPVGYVSAAKRHVTFGLLHGDAIRDDSGLLQGSGKSPIRKAVFAAGAPVPQTAVRAWLDAARALDPSWGR